MIAGNSTSFGWATRLLQEPVRTHVRSIFALVRLADEIVDDPFFASMRAVLTVHAHDRDSLGRYVHGSAEVVGLMCLRVVVDGDETLFARLVPAASALGAAFQKVNFLRDLAEDHDQLGRDHLPGVEVDDFDDAQRDRLLDDIDTDLARAVLRAHR